MQVAEEIQEAVIEVRDDDQVTHDRSVKTPTSSSSAKNGDGDVFENESRRKSGTQCCTFAAD